MRCACALCIVRNTHEMEIYDKMGVNETSKTRVNKTSQTRVNETLQTQKIKT